MVNITVIVSIVLIIVLLIVLSKKAKQNRMQNALKYNFINENFEKARDYFKEEEEQGNIEATIYLARLYHGGLRDRPPDAKKALKYYKKAVDLGVYYCLLNIGDIHNYGLENVAQDQRRARKYYTRLTEFCERGNSDLDKYYLTQARQRLDVIDASYGPGGFFYDSGIGAREADNHIEIDLDVQRVFDRARKLKQNNTFRRDYIDTIRIRNHLPVRINADGNRERVPPALDNPVVVHNDSQNVHDRILNQTISQSVQNLKNDTPLVIPTDTSLYEVKKAIQNLTTGSKQSNAINTLNSLGSRAVGANATSEKGILSLVWNRIQGYTNSEQKRIATENLVNELSDVQESGKPWCSTGKFNRIIDSLNKIDPAVEIKPTWALNRELMDTAANFRKKLLEEEPDDVKAAIDSKQLTPEVEKAIDEFNDKFKSHLVQKFERDYVDSGIISKEELTNQTSAWIDHV